jgi:hypothetical protein
MRDALDRAYAENCQRAQIEPEVRMLSPGESAARAARQSITEKLEADALVQRLRYAFSGPLSKEKLYQARTVMSMMSDRQD